MTQAELADAAGLHSKAVEKIETGCRSPRPATLRKLADALGVSARDLAEAAQEE